MAFKSKKTVSFKGTGGDGSSLVYISKKQASAFSMDSQTLTLEMLFEALQDKVVTLIEEKFNEINEKLQAIIEEIPTGKQHTEVMVTKVGEIQNKIEIKEQKQQDLKETMLEVLAQFPREKVTGWLYDKVYRVNSWAARQKHLPRDIVRYFNSRTVRNEILQATSKNKNKLQFKGQDVMTMKEIPPKMLRVRSDINFIIS